MACKPGVSQTGTSGDTYRVFLQVMIQRPTNCDHKMLLLAVRNYEKVYACDVNKSTYATGVSYMTSAAKVVFFNRDGC